MSSIKKNSDFSRIFDLIEKSLNIEMDTVRDALNDSKKPFPQNPTFRNSATEQKNQYGNLQSDEQYYEDVNSNSQSYDQLIFADVEEYSNQNQEIDNYMEKTSFDAIDKTKDVFAKDQQITSGSRRYTKNISRDKLREAVAWSEILGSPVCKRRQGGGVRRHR